MLQNCIEFSEVDPTHQCIETFSSLNTKQKHLNKHIKSPRAILRSCSHLGRCQEHSLPALEDTDYLKANRSLLKEPS